MEAGMDTDGSSSDESDERNLRKIITYKQAF
jgi:hypothetical protein